MRWVGTAVLLVVGLAVPLVESTRADTNAWTSQFYNNENLSGSPVLTRTDSKIDFDWGDGAPAAGVTADHFSARFTKSEWFDRGSYRFSVRSDDGLRLWVGDLLVFDNWGDQQGEWQEREVALYRGVLQVTVEYYENTGEALVSADWEQVGIGSNGSWVGYYYDNKYLHGQATVKRVETAVDFDWKKESPTSEVPVDTFSARWARSLDFEAGTYRFSASADDGVRVWLDSELIIDAWQNQTEDCTHTAVQYLNDGPHRLRVTYYEDDGAAAIHFFWDRIDVEYSGWKGEYFANRSLSGNPSLVRSDNAIDFDWGVDSPSPRVPDIDNFSARWTRTINFAPGYYRFSTQSDDGVRVWLDNGLVIDKWKEQDYVLHYVDGIFLSGTHEIRVEYFERGGNARIRFWIGPFGTTATLTPTAIPPAPTGNWRGEYWNNRTLSGNPMVVRSDAAIGFDWGAGSPAAGIIGADYFSARWTQNVWLEAGAYRFTLSVDDGARLWVGDQLVLDTWMIQAVHTYTADATLPAGTTPIKLEYYEHDGLASVNLSWALIVPPPKTLMVDNASPGFAKGGPTSAWHTGTGGQGDSYIWTRNNDYARANYNWARWHWYTDLAPGYYEVYAYVPAGNSTTTNACYEVRHADGNTLVQVDQSAHQEEWVSLGVHRFVGSDTEYVSLADITYESYLSKHIAFDAMFWDLR